MRIFQGMSIAELLEARARLQQRILSGNQTVVSLAPGMRDEFQGKSEAELRRLLLEVNYELFKLDPEVYTDPYRDRVMQVVSVFEG